MERELRSRQAGSAIRRCLDGLGLHQHEVFILRELEDMNMKEISATLGLTLSHCGVLMHRARMRLQNCLEHAGWKTL